MNKRIFLSPPEIGPREYELVREALDSNYVAPTGPMLDGFEADLAAYTGFPEIVAVSSGTAAIHLVLRLLGIGPGDRVAAPSFTFIGSVTPIVFQGAEPVFLDSAPDNWLLDPVVLETTLARSAREGRPIRAVIGVDLYGQPGDAELYRKICARHGAEFVTDAAESLGSRLHDAHAGLGGRFACLSFNGNKIITTSGGGALACEDPAMAARARNLAQQARRPVAHYEHDEIGYNYRMSNISAAIGRAQLETIEERVARRRAVFDAYRERLGALEFVSLMPEVAGARGNRWLSCILLDPDCGFRPEDVRLALEAENIEARALWKPMHLQPVFREARMEGGHVCEDLFARGLCLPSGADATSEIIDRVGCVIERLAGRA